MDVTKEVNSIGVGVVGLGLMGCSIATCLVIAGHRVVAVAPIATDLQHADARIQDHLIRSYNEGLIHEVPEHYLKHLTITENYSLLRDCKIVIECTLENLEI